MERRGFAVAGPSSSPRQPCIVAAALVDTTGRIVSASIGPTRRS